MRDRGQEQGKVRFHIERGRRCLEMADRAQRVLVRQAHLELGALHIAAAAKARLETAEAEEVDHLRLLVMEAYSLASREYPPDRGTETLH